MPTYLYLHRENTAGPQDRYLGKYPLKHVDYELSRAVGRKGEIISDVRGGRIRIVLDGLIRYFKSCKEQFDGKSAEEKTASATENYYYIDAKLLP